MEIEESPLFAEVTKIIQGGPTDTNYGWECVFQYGDNKTYIPLKVIGVNIIRDYLGSFTDSMSCTVLMGLGGYARQIYPNRTGMQMTLKKMPMSENKGASDPKQAIQEEIYSAILISNMPSPTQAQGAEALDEEALNLQNIVEVSFQLFNKSMEQIRLMPVGGVFRRTKVDSLLLSMLTTESSKADVDDQRAILGVDITPVSNKDSKEQIIITHGTKLIDVPDYLQKRVGIYNAGLGSYIQNKHWFIFPLYDTNLFQTRQDTLTVFVLPKRKYSDIERTFSVNGDSVTLLMTGETGFSDDNGTQYLNQGNGARFADASKLMDSSNNLSNNKVVVSRALNNKEFIADTRNDGINHVPIPNQRITANPFTVYSQLNARKGGYFKGVWQNSDSSIIFPGMITRIIYSDIGSIKEIYGVVHICEHVSHKLGDINNNAYSNQSVISIYVNPAKEIK
jgi:hypothetical protein